MIYIVIINYFFRVKNELFNKYQFEKISNE